MLNNIFLTLSAFSNVTLINVILRYSNERMICSAHVNLRRVLGEGGGGRMHLVPKMPSPHLSKPGHQDTSTPMLRIYP